RADARLAGPPPPPGAARGGPGAPPRPPLPPPPPPGRGAGGGGAASPPGLGGTKGVLISLPAVAAVAPGNQALHVLVVERRPHAEDDVCDADGGEAVQVAQLVRADAHRALDGRRVAPHLRAPLVQHAVLALPVAG